MDEIVSDIKDIKSELKNLVRMVQKLDDDTRGVVEIYNNTQSLIKTGVVAQKFGLWLLKWPLIGAALFGAYQWFLDKAFQ